MATQSTPYGYSYPQPSDPVRDGATNIATLAGQIKAPEMFSGQPCLAGSLPGGQNARVQQIVYNYSPPTDAFGYARIPLPFTQCCLSAFAMGRNQAQNVTSLVVSQQYTSVTSLVIFVRSADGQPVPNGNIDMTITAWGF